MPFTSTIDPVLLQLGPLQIRYYGIAYVLGFLLMWWWLRRAANKGMIRLTTQQIEDIVFWLMVGVVVGARLGHVLFWNLPYFLANPLKIFAVWEGGMAFHGGLIGIVLAGWLWCRKHSFSFYPIADILTVPVIFGLALGRFANFTNGELYGPITNVPWCVQFPGVEGCRHPYQLYSACKRVLIGLVLLMLSHKHWKEGFLFWLLLAVLGAGRFFLDFLREDARWFGLSIGQYLSAAVFLIAAFILLHSYRSPSKTI
ncbi:MAG TPA: prolipoprotein diacylglyceryl transferase [Candidatus Nanoarchaeia archaeon]|nr:prolipoprotein diacylglyceryl transferase [Candidatus Nanoarchaeia archaeon]